MSSVLVTGAAGFIGRHLVRRLLSEGRRVVALDNAPLDKLPPAVDRIGWDITHGADGAVEALARSLRELEVTSCVHLAAIAAPRQAEANPQLAWATNVTGTFNVLGALRMAGARKVVFASSAHVYGISPRYLPTDENHPLALLDTYTTTKIIGEQLCQLFHANYGLSSTVLRLFNAYGPGQSDAYFIGAKLQQGRTGKHVTLMNAEVTKDWVWIDDVVEAFVCALATDFVGPINIGTGAETSLAYITKIIARVHDVPVEADPRRDDSPTRMCCDNARARQVLHWAPKITIDDGLRRLIDGAAF